VGTPVTEEERQDTQEEKEYVPVFKKNYTARQYYSHQKAGIRTAIYEQLPGMWDALEEKPPQCRKWEDLLDLQLGAFMGVTRAFSKTYNMGSMLEDFLG